ncbi:MAG: hypothetical protein MUC36_09215 [Planctomycetes bacterium]|jgi:aldehyde dehydrogenase (NAD(P)+)|nr:hypothetical protein [Planctomycetota bacterium]
MLPPSIDAELTRLRRGAAALQQREPGQVADLIAACRRSLAASVDAWVAASVAAKGWGGFAAALAEEWASGPVPVARSLHQLEHLHRELHAGRLPGLQTIGVDRHRLPPSPGLADRLLLPGLRVLLQAAPGARITAPRRRGGVALVLGAGNVTATPVLDVLDQVFRNGRAVVLKPSPLHEPLVRHFAAALAPLQAADLLAIAPSDHESGRTLTRAGFDAVHLTGSGATWNALRAEPALAAATLTAEVGCCTPALVVPGRWRDGQLQWVARQLARYVAMNGGGTCLAPRLLLTAAEWPQRQQFLALLDAALAAEPARPPFHPSARRHWEAAAGRQARDSVLPPVRREGLDPRRDAALLASEHFAPVLLDVPLGGDSLAAFLGGAVGLVRDQVFGALSAYVFAPPALLRAERSVLDAAIARLPHGTVAINTWTGLGYGLGSTPWGAPPGAADEAGRGQVHGWLGLDGVRQVVLDGPFASLPRPPWLAPPRRAAATLRSLCGFYLAPGSLGLARTVLCAMLPRREAAGSADAD